MSTAIDRLLEAQKNAISVRPKVGGFPHLAGILRQAVLGESYIETSPTVEIR